MNSKGIIGWITLSLAAAAINVQAAAQQAANTPAYAPADVALAIQSCSEKTQPILVVHASGKSEFRYTASNQDIHYCQWIFDVAASPCVKTNSCPSYPVWSQANPGFSPKSKRAVFLAEFERRQHEIASRPLS